MKRWQSDGFVIRSGGAERMKRRSSGVWLVMMIGITVRVTASVATRGGQELVQRHTVPHLGGDLGICSGSGWRRGELRRWIRYRVGLGTI